jgi:hypothetical protein
VSGENLLRTWNKLFFHFAFYSHKCAYLYFIDNTIARWSTPVRQLLRNLQMRRAFIAAITSEKREMTIKKSLFRHWPLIINFLLRFANPCTM